jgi:hypothetical protein
MSTASVSDAGNEQHNNAAGDVDELAPSPAAERGGGKGGTKAPDAHPRESDSSPKGWMLKAGGLDAF